MKKLIQGRMLLFRITIRNRYNKFLFENLSFENE